MTAEREADLLVVGGGINGAGIARDAAGRGLSVILAEQGDLGGATSSASSKLIHGGLRYLEMYAFRLVRESLAERETLLRLAPHIVWPLRFVLPHNRTLRPAWMIRAGLFLYDRLGGKRTLPAATSLDLGGGPQGAPLRPEVVRGFEYSDCWVEDSRLVILNAMDAAERGAEVLARTRCDRAERAHGRWRAELVNVVTGERRVVRSRILINAAGPWVDHFHQQALGRAAEGRLRLVKGSHIVVPRLYEGAHAYILQNSDRRIVFALPYQRDFTLVGTTDLPYEGDPAAVTATPEEIAYLLDALGQYFTDPPTEADVVHAFSGVRPLYDDHKANPSAVTRDYVFDIEAPDGTAPLLSIFGGKLTTYRRLAEHVMDKLKPFLPGLPTAWTAKRPLPGGDLPGGSFDRFLGGLRAAYPFLPPALAWRYARFYGTRCELFLRGRTSLDDLGEPFGAGLYEAEVDYLIDQEWARTTDDILWRRTRLGLTMPPEGRDALTERLTQHFAQRPLTAEHGRG